MTPHANRIYTMLILGWLLSAFFVFQGVTSSLHQYNLLRAMQSHGAKSNAKITSYFKSNCTKHGCTTNANYKFTPSGYAPGIVFYGHDALGDDWSPGDPQFNLARRSGIVPIAYDTSNPNVSAINFRNHLFWMPAKSYLKTNLINNAIPFFIFPSLIFLVWGKELFDKYKGGPRA
jgi:hypothetical protein